MALVKIAVGVRPFNKMELAMNAKNDCTNGWQKNTDFQYKDFTFDHSYWPCDANDDNYASQKEVFNDLGTDVIKSTFEGYDAYVFAYSQAGTAKTFTMMGTSEAQGLIPREKT
ncbi:kinesin-like protein Klp98A [Bombus vancouverensis nearcticus]|uniref:kinesin-like protein Klp98A n=1 Tax=Bombus vancouverensis nearcticus TaxID=2705178 RepID=UPI00402BDF60